MSTLSWPSAKSFDRFPLDGSVLISTLGLVFALSGVAFWSQSLLPAAETVSEALYELVMHVLFGLVILVLGIHIERSELVPEERWEVILWCFSAFLFFWLAVWSELDAVLSATLTRDLVSNVVVFGSISGAFGGIIGVNRGRATRNGILAERTEDQRETLELLTRLLRHDIRNDMQAISAHAGFLEDEVTEEGASSLAVIEQRSDAVLRLLEDTSTLLETLGSDRELRPVSLKSVIDREVSSLRDSHPALTVETTVPDDLQVVADGLLHQPFLNLLTNAVAHNDPETLTVAIDAASNGELAEITVRDDGSGIPEEIEETLFELGKKGPGSSGDGLGLYRRSRPSASGLAPEGEGRRKSNQTTVRTVDTVREPQRRVKDRNPTLTETIWKCDSSQNPRLRRGVVRKTESFVITKIFDFRTTTGVVGRGGAADPHGRTERSGVNSSRPTVGRSRGIKFACDGTARFGTCGQDGEAAGLVPAVLHLVSRLVDLYGGTVAPAESPSGGAQFDTTLPAAD